ncbi:hypothetical protein GUITHDRAFT_113937 [Guillardia theta CCMP2712]|uniref:O-acyltransferase n=2 Tax=Guillardia theta TaxID=55529 RepID=L1IVS7_GUITC|nr:hypothetical protein GUITHDRAFT_113937 [Guillardia theta CCMP2712]EKX39945.1 hypothetical protein GUITHDRAFT_113937 [Guillardia theta CCMP2712]|eukprot:XP_005826925.1 hypothetical protein GUITHDRAFT_113937 [Guillardia theta CCMP2712]
MCQPSDESGAVATQSQEKQNQQSSGNPPEEMHVKLNEDGNFLSFAPRPSLFSSEHPSNSYRGFVNVLIILLLMSNLRIVIQNLYKYGLLINPWHITHLGKSDNVCLAFSLWFYVFVAYGIEKLHGYVYSPIIKALHWTNAIASFVVPWYAIWYFRTDPSGGIIVLVFATTAFMKIVSFFLVCDRLRAEAKSKDKKFKPKLRQLLYFIAAPTLVFSPRYPRTAKIRWGWVLRRIWEFIGIWAGIYVVARQYVMPGLMNTLVPLENGSFFLIVEGLLKIAVPNFLIWILGFYSIFHLYLNILAELTRFGDRQFYKDWWNSTTLGYFWRTWNLPVHSWMVEHVYMPLTTRGWRKSPASIFIFIISAIFHELIVSIPFWNFKLLAFGGMMLQVPLIELTKCLKGSQTGNVIFWLSIMLGQPLIVLLYARDYAQGLYGPWTDADTKTVGKILNGFQEAMGWSLAANLTVVAPPSMPPSPTAVHWRFLDRFYKFMH